MKKAVLLLIAVLGVLEFAVGQETITQNSVFAVGKINPSWSYRAEAHFIRGDFLKEAQRYILRPSVTYSFSKELELSGGVSYLYNLSSEGNPATPNEEFNTWEQLGLRHSLGRFKFYHWLRFEQRNTFSGYRQRFRYRIVLSSPIQLAQNFKLTALSFNEHFVHIKNFGFNGFNQNWTFIGLQFPIGNRLLFRSGYRATTIRQGEQNVRINAVHSWLIFKIL